MCALYYPISIKQAEREREVYIKSLSYNKETRDCLNDYYKDYILRFLRSEFDYLAIVETDCEWL